MLATASNSEKNLRAQKPKWLRSQIPGGQAYAKVKSIVRKHELHTVCESATCPNLGECWSRGTATFMILGNICTRGCRFCDVPKGKPIEYDRDEPRRVADSAMKMGLKYAVITSVSRDDLPDQGAEVWAETLYEVRNQNPGIRIEALIPDMQAKPELLDIILTGKPDVLNHNFETVKRLQKSVRGRANFETSAFVLHYAKQKGFLTKTSFMLGLGEELFEVHEMLHECVKLGVDIVTFGQYLRPGVEHLPVERFWNPQEFSELKAFAHQLGIKHCESAPMVRSSYHAEEVTHELFNETNKTRP